MRNDISLGILISSGALSFSLVYYLGHNDYSPGILTVFTIALGLLGYKLIKKIMEKKQNGRTNRKV